MSQPVAQDLVGKGRDLPRRMSKSLFFMLERDLRHQVRPENSVSLNQVRILVHDDLEARRFDW